MAERVAGCLGKLPAQDFGDQNVLLTSVLAAPLPTAPKSFGHGTMFADWGYLGNDQVGDCAEAMACHAEMLFTGLGNRGKNAAKFTTANAIKLYSEVTGYNPNDPSTDRGTYYTDLFDYWRNSGIGDAAGRNHKIDLAVRLTGSKGSFDWATFVNAVNVFKVVGVGTLIPRSAETQFQEDKPWAYVGDQDIVGGHAIPAVGSVNSDNQVTIITWSKRQIMDRDFFDAYVDELWIPLSREALKPIESALHTVDWGQVETIANGLA
jgi:hypothetical protein